MKENVGKPILEICVDSVESGINAEKGGADRIELCSNLIIGGTTPTENLFKEVKKNINIPINVLIRPRFGDFLYTDYEINIIKNEIKSFRKLGANGVVIGLLTSEGEIDTENMKNLLSERGDMEVTFHRAFDVCKNPYDAYKELQKLKIDTILTSGQNDSCLNGKEVLKKLVQMSKENNEEKNPEIMVGAGLTLENIEEIYRYTNANTFHLSAKTIINSKMVYKKENVNMGLKEFSEYEKLETDVYIVKQIRNKLTKLAYEKKH